MMRLQSWRWRAFDAVCGLLSVVMTVYYVQPMSRSFMGMSPVIWAWSWGITAGLCALSVLTNGTGVMIASIQRLVRAALTGGPGVHASKRRASSKALPITKGKLR